MNQNNEEAQQNIEMSQEKRQGDDLPVGIARIRTEWKEYETPEDSSADAEEIMPVVFSELDGGAGIGDYSLEQELVRTTLALSDEAMERLISSGELDSIVVRNAEGDTRRLFSVASVNRFQVDSAIDPQAINTAAEAIADLSTSRAVEELALEVQELRNTQGKILQQMKDMLLLEVRNLKEQDRDLTSFVYELAEEIRNSNKKQKK